MRGIFLFGLILSVLFSSAQGPYSEDNAPKEKPKVGLVLSGGGARGFAHLGVIKVLEEAGIKPDIITGTSMGSIVGALYALGMSTDQVSEAAGNADWGSIMSNEVSFDNIAFEEKMFYNRWITDFRQVNGKFVLRSGLIEGQELQMYLSRYTRTGHHHNKFTDYPIPYACVGADIASGEAWKMDSGNVVTAIRASMAIPSVFTPVERDNRLLVDGGLVRAMPVEEAIGMGADIIIAVFVGADLDKKEDLVTAADILEQSAFILSAYDTEKQKSLADILIRPDFRDLTNMDFEESQRFFEYGEEAARQQMDALKKLAVDIYGESVPYKREPVELPETYTINQISVKGLDRITKNFVMSKLEMEMDQPYSLEDIEKSVRQLYGTLYFDKVTYNIKSFPSGTTELALEVEEVSPAEIKVAMFYNSETLAGISLNYTRRNGLIRNSRAIVEFAFAENPRGIMQYFKYLGRDQKFAASTGLDFQTIHDFVWLNFQGTETRYTYTHTGAFLGIQKTGSLKRSYGLMLNGNYTRLTPRVNADTVLSRYHEQALFTTAWYAYNSLNRVYFPSKGWKGRIRLGGTLTASRKFDLQNGQGFWEDLTADREPMEFVALVDGRVINYAPVSKKVSIVSGASISMHASGDALLLGSAKLGGIRPVLPGRVAFWGEDPNSFVNKDLVTIHAGAQWNITGSWFLEGRVNYANPTYPMIWFIDHKQEDQFQRVDGSWDDLWGGGLMINYMSGVGPLSFGYHQSNRGSSAEWFLQLGFSL